MSFFNRIFSNRRSASQKAPASRESDNSAPSPSTREYAQLTKFTQALNALLMSDKYLARSDYRPLVEEYAELNSFFQNQKAAKTLNYYCSANGVPGAEVEAFLRNYADIANLESGSESIRRHNQTFLERHLESEKYYLDNILKSVDPAISLDAEQRQVEPESGQDADCLVEEGGENHLRDAFHRRHPALPPRRQRGRRRRVLRFRSKHECEERRPGLVQCERGQHGLRLRLWHEQQALHGQEEQVLQ